MKYFLHAYNLSLFFLALGSVVLFGRRKSVPAHPPRKVLIVQLAKLGDMVCFTPVLHALRHHSPQTKIYLLGNALNRELLRGNTDIDEYVVFDPKKLFSTILYLHRENIDVACNRGTGYIGLVILLLAGIKTIVAARVVEGKSFETRTYKWLLPYVYTVDFRFGEYMPRQFLRLLHPLGIFSDDTRKHLTFSERARTEIDQFFIQSEIDTKKDFVVGVCPSAGSKIKEWPGVRFAEVIDSLTQKHHARVLLIGGPGDTKEVQSVIKNLKNSEGVINVQGKFTLDAIKALISKTNLFISVDTGPIYIAEAFDIPTIDIVGPVDEREQPPQGFIHRNVVPPHRVKAELFILNARMYNREEAIRQTLSITSSAVIKEVDRLISDVRSHESL